MRFEDTPWYRWWIKGALSRKIQYNPVIHHILNSLLLRQAIFPSLISPFSEANPIRPRGSCGLKQTMRESRDMSP